MQNGAGDKIDALVVALPETAGSALYGMIDVLNATGNLWQQLVGEEPGDSLIRPHIVSPDGRDFHCGNGIPVQPAFNIEDDPAADIVIVPELWLAPDDAMDDRYFGRSQTLFSPIRPAALLPRAEPHPGMIWQSTSSRATAVQARL
jgi:hypothetical protein